MLVIFLRLLIVMLINRAMRGKMRHLRTFIVVEWKAQQFEFSF